MQSIRQVGVGIILAIVSILLQIPPTLPLEFPTPTATTTSTSLTPSETPTETQTATATTTETLLAATATQCIPPAGWIRITTAALEPADAVRLADALAALGRAPSSTYSG